MLFYISLYLLAAILLFQGVHALGEQNSPMGVVPSEVRTDSARASLWGGFLVAIGSMLILAGLVSHCNAWTAGALGPLRALGVLTLAGYSLWLVFNRKVDYTPALSQATTDHSHH